MQQSVTRHLKSPITPTYSNSNVVAASTSRHRFACWLADLILVLTDSVTWSAAAVITQRPDRPDMGPGLERIRTST